MKERRWNEPAEPVTTEGPRGAPGKRTRVDGLFVQLRLATVRPAAAQAPPPPAPADERVAEASEDPFGVHLLGSVQRRGEGGRDPAEVHAAAARGIEGPATALPFVAEIQRSFGPDHDVSGVKAHVGGAAAEATAAMGASAYATGDHVAFGGAPDLHTAAHEAAHVVQQTRGVNLLGGVGDAGDVYERHADEVAERVVAGVSAADLLAAGPGGGDAAGAVQRKGHGKAKAHANGGFAEYGGERVRDVLTRLAREGRLAISATQIAVLDAMAQVETDGRIGCVQTYDDQVVSVGFKQVVLGHGSLEKIMTRAPAGFAKHGLALDPSKSYDHPGWSRKPKQIAGCEHLDELRGRAWGMKFYAASMEPDVVAAIAELALAELGKVEGAIHKHAGGIDHFDDPTAEGWLLETYNNRPAFMAKAIQRAVAAGARAASSRDAFLDLLAHAIVETYAVEEPLLHYKKAKRRGHLTGEDDARLLEDARRQFEPVGRRKGTNIITKIPRNLHAPTGHEAAHATHTAHAAGPAPTGPAAPAAPARAERAERLMSLPASEPEAMSIDPGEAQLLCGPDDPHATASAASPADPHAAHPAPAPASSRVHVDDVHRAIATHVPGAEDVAHGHEHGHGAHAAHAHDHAPEPHDGLVQASLEHRVQALPAAAAAPGHDAAHYRNVDDATARMSPEVKALYDQCLALAHEGTLCFPGNEKEAPQATSAPFRAFIHALYEQRRFKERRVNLEILKRGGGEQAKAFHMKDYLESIQAPIPGACYHGKPENQRLHPKALEAFLRMRKAADADGVPLIIVHGFRPPKNKGPSGRPKAIASNSSHSYGLAIDLQLSVDARHSGTGHALHVKETNTHDMANVLDYYRSSVTKWMLDHARDFGFFPYQPEPWHYEYNPEGMAQEIVDGAHAFRR